jgi:hypothetical protein
MKIESIWRVICSTQDKIKDICVAVARLGDARNNEYVLVRCRKVVSESGQGTKGQFNHSYSAAR